jgi:hypothetical protein
MTKRIFVDRSRYETGLRCQRMRYLEYHWGGTGLAPMKKSLPLCVGGSVHVGLAAMLQDAQTALNDKLSNSMVTQTKLSGMTQSEADLWRMIEERAVAAALADFEQYAKQIEAEHSDNPTLADPALGINPTRYDMDEYLFLEQSALVEGMVRAYARRRLRPLLEEYEVLEVERGGEWKLSEWAKYKGMMEHDYSNPPISGTKERSLQEDYELWFMSRPDALLRDRQSNQLILLSFKTATSWDIRKARDAEHDMQGMSEGIEIERRLADWWEAVRKIEAGGNIEHEKEMVSDVIDARMYNYLLALDAPPRILAVRYEYMLKGERWKDRDLSERFGVEMRSQKSHLVRQYVAVSTPQRGAAGYSIGDVCWSWDFVRDDGRDGSLAWQNWKSRPVWGEPGGVRGWIDKLADAAETMSGEDTTVGMEPRLLGYKCDAQSVGVTKVHPLDAIFLPPMLIYRNEDELRDLVEQMESVERRVAEGVEEVGLARDDADARHLLNVHFPMTRRACEYPTSCSYIKLCYGGENIRKDPLGSGLYKIRTPNHPQENNVGEQQ